VTPTPRPTPTVLPGTHERLGATPGPTSTTFAVWAPEATGVELCLFDADGEQRVALPDRTLGVWHGAVPGVGPGRRYGFRADGPYDPDAGHRFNPNRLLLDPYARAVTGVLDPTGPVDDVPPDDLRFARDSAAHVPLSVVVDDRFDWGDDGPPRTPWADTVVYEAHVRGLTMRHPGVPEPLRGTYAGLAHPSVVDELLRLGVTAVELLPVQQFVTEPGVRERGLVNYWGYNTLGFFAPHGAYASTGDGGGQVAEFKQLVKTLHAAGIEVLLDVVYNHTAEGGPGGPTLSLRGLGDGSYYRQEAGGGYADVTGCGNTVQVAHPAALRLVTDSLRYWVTEMHVDGFRFDLAPALLRTAHGPDPAAPLLTAIDRDPVLRDVKLVAEPWDATSEGYLLGRFPPPWREWNDRFRDTVRDFWRGRSGGVRDLAYRLSGSSDLYGDDGRRPFASVNLVTAHDGLTLRDLVSYEHKHNEANGEDGRDGTGDDRSWNCGAEGESDDCDVLALRRRQAANLLGTLLLSTGVPMLVAGDERGRTQRGNNNAFCHDGPLTWVDWAPDPQWAHLTDLTTRLVALRGAHPVLRQRLGPLSWLHPDGREMQLSDWYDATLATVGMLRDGSPLEDRKFLLWLHAGADAVPLWTPSGSSEAGGSPGWEVLADTSGAVTGQRLSEYAAPRVPGRTLLLLGSLPAH